MSHVVELGPISGAGRMPALFRGRDAAARAAGKPSRKRDASTKEQQGGKDSGREARTTKRRAWRPAEAPLRSREASKGRAAAATAGTGPKMERQNKTRAGEKDGAVRGQVPDPSRRRWHGCQAAETRNATYEKGTWADDSTPPRTLPPLAGCQRPAQGVYVGRGRTEEQPVWSDASAWACPRPTARWTGSRPSGRPANTGCVDIDVVTVHVEGKGFTT